MLVPWLRELLTRHSNTTLASGVGRRDLADVLRDRDTVETQAEAVDQTWIRQGRGVPRGSRA